MTGDGVVVRFDDPTTAIDFAMAVQAAAEETNRRARTHDQHYRYRIGVGHGQILLRALGPRVEGCGVPFIEAARLEARCPPNGILVSAATWAALGPAAFEGQFHDENEYEGKHPGETFRGRCWKGSARCFDPESVSP